MNTIHFTGTQVLFLMIMTLAGVILSVTFHFPLVIGFLPGFLVLVIFCLSKQVRVKDLFYICKNGIYKTKIVLIILLLVSFLLPSWYLSGTISQMVTIALDLITPKHFLVLSFLATMIFSMILGTSVGTLSSIGVPIMSTAIVLHLPVEMVAGALISGAFVGDRTSPFSSSHQLLANTVELPIKRQGKAMFFTTIVAIVIALFFYSISDIVISGSISSHIQSVAWKDLSIVKFLPPLLLILFVLFRFSIVTAFLASILSACVIAGLDGILIVKMIRDFWQGIEGLGGGLIHMYQLLLFLALAGAYNGLLEEMNVIKPYLDRWLQTSQSLLSDTIKTLVATLLISMIAANQTLPIILTGRSFLPHWSTKYGKEELARVMGDTTMLFPGIIPWSVFAIMCSTIVGVPLLNYLPYAIFPWILPCITLIVSLYKQMRVVKKSPSAVM
ncbi:Na+/H+ antiporter NhaC family protein [Neobacillus sp. PS3-40]|uniref:Na+/H+ antiporter NhaC family protein n=1 Tax=Neobacillus sp. PS3-40 TaxID=3070679 RepID=UPI0027DF6A40|nr:Na+/H+ antiporter NhaC family protein [Neobacillus sp. PS3-40]WML44765.1 Na+/H+ antiporter NhaC family protein [Neobacillus sp. PS3-40]